MMQRVCEDANMEPVHKGVRLISPARLKELSRRSDIRGWAKTLAHIAAIAANSYALAHSWGNLLAIPLFMLQGALLVCLQAAIHEMSHRTVFKTRVFNEVFGRLFSVVVLILRSEDKFQHTAHHLYTNDPERDPEIAGVTPDTLWSHLLNFSAIPTWPRRISKLISLALGRDPKLPYLSPSQLRVVQTEARQNIAIYAVIAGLAVVLKTWAPLTMWLLPMVAMKFVHQLENMAEHGGLPHVNNIVENTRTMPTHPIMRWLLWNMPYHTAHHKYPSVPFFCLPQLHHEAFEESGVTPPSMGYISFQWHMIRKLIKEKSSWYSGKPLSSY